VKQVRATLSEAEGQWTDRVIIPRKLRVKGDTLIATVSRRALGGRPSSRWARQARGLGMDAFADPGTMVIREVNQLSGSHRFGGGTDSDCDPNILDLVAATDEEQAKALGFLCAWEEGGPVPATLSLVSP
ncbi:MAG: glucodextranase DOMON-like domain-containing protein, partial [Myxococcota bacterium]|nr:glucodextranase DOMON-like domain-containing protein [Myxococcota bacterium]